MPFKKLCLFIFGLFFLTSISLAKEKIDDFQKNFNIAKQHLSLRQINKALPYLQYLHEKQPHNANLKYLIGVCYAEEEIVNPETINLLEYASAKASLEYDPNSLLETRVPIYVYYYLCVAYAQNGFCDKADIARSKFLEVYPHQDPFYINESKRWVNHCKKLKEKPEIDTIPYFPDFKPYVSKPKLTNQVEEDLKPSVILQNREKQRIEEEKIIKTKHVEYSTRKPLYGVQLGAFKEVVPVSRFKELKNVEAFMDKKGLIRYVIGHFSINSQAESLLEIIRQKGYLDAFVVNVNNEKKFSDEVVSVNDVNIKANLIGRVEYRVQIGAFKERIPRQTANMYFKVDGISELRDQELTYLTVGKYRSYDEAKSSLLGIKNAGINDAFVIAVNNGKKISIQQAKDFYNE